MVKLTEIYVVKGNK